MIYIVIDLDNYNNKFENTVNEYLANGWILQGGVSVSDINGNYLQALIKEDTTNNAPLSPTN